jgi:hypothetical protein
MDDDTHRGRPLASPSTKRSIAGGLDILTMYDDTFLHRTKHTDPVKEDHVSLHLQTHAGARLEALRHDADVRRLTRDLHEQRRTRMTFDPAGAHRMAHPAHAPADTLLARLRVRLGHALVAVGLALEGAAGEAPASR